MVAISFAFCPSTLRRESRTSPITPANHNPPGIDGRIPISPLTQRQMQLAVALAESDPDEGDDPLTPAEEAVRETIIRHRCEIIQQTWTKKERYKRRWLTDGDSLASLAKSMTMTRRGDSASQIVGI